MEKFKTKKLLALLAVGAVMTTAAAGVAMSANFHGAAFADTSLQDDETPTVGTAEKPAVVNDGVNTISYLFVDGAPEMGYAQLVYYMTITPEASGIYSFAQSDYNIGVNDVYSENEWVSGEWNDDLTKYSVELSQGVDYTVQIVDFDWELDLSGYKEGDVYKLAEPVTITVSYKAIEKGSDYNHAIAYKVGDVVEVPAGHAPVWYSFTAEAGVKYYLISYSGNVVANKLVWGNPNELASANSGYSDLYNNGIVYLCITPTDTEYASIEVVKAADETAGSSIVTPIVITAGQEVGDGKWYSYTVGEENKTASVTPVEGAEVIVNENETITLCGSVDVYDGYNYIGTLNDGTFTPAILPEKVEGEEAPVYTDVELTAGKTYYFHAKAYVYEGTNSAGEEVTLDIMSLLVIK